MGLKWKFQRGGGGGLNQKTFRGRGMDILWNNTFENFLGGGGGGGGMSPDPSLPLVPHLSQKCGYGPET